MPRVSEHTLTDSGLRYTSERVLRLLATTGKPLATDAIARHLRVTQTIISRACRELTAEGYTVVHHKRGNTLVHEATADGRAMLELMDGAPAPTPAPETNGHGPAPEPEPATPPIDRAGMEAAIWHWVNSITPVELAAMSRGKLTAIWEGIAR